MRRETMETPLPALPQLTDCQIARAQRINPWWLRQLRIVPTTISEFPVDSAAFALDVADRQAVAGLAIDGIVNVQTALKLLGPTPRLQCLQCLQADDDRERLTETRPIRSGYDPVLHNL